MGLRDELRFILENDLDDLRKYIDRIDSLSDDDLNSIFSTHRRDGVKSRFKSKIKSYF